MATKKTPKNDGTPKRRGRPAGRSKVPENETKEARFIRLSKQRMVGAITRLRSVAKLANRSTYEYTDEQVAKMLEALNREVQAVEEAFRRAPKGTKEVTFDF